MTSFQPLWLNCEPLRRRRAWCAPRQAGALSRWDSRMARVEGPATRTIPRAERPWEEAMAAMVSEGFMEEHKIQSTKLGSCSIRG